MIIEQIDCDVVITKGQYTFTFGGCTLLEVLEWSITDFFGCDSNQDHSVVLDLAVFEYLSLKDQIRKAL